MPSAVISDAYLGNLSMCLGTPADKVSMRFPSVPKYVIQPKAPTLRQISGPVIQPLIQQPTDAPGQQEPRRIPQVGHGTGQVSARTAG